MEDIQLSTFGELLKAFRKQRQITQHKLATHIGAHRNTIGIWERGDGLPESKTVVLELAHHLHLDTQETRRLLEASLTALSPYWHLPYQRNPFFTGREGVLHQLHDALTHECAAILSQSYALSGLGGIGKTQTAIEYTYRYANDYTAVFWISAETAENIISTMIAIASLLNLPEKQEQDQEKVVAAVTRWLTNHRDWLLIFDNVEDPALIKRFLPPARCGSLLFTSRRQSLGLSAQALDLERMTPEEGMRFLLHRARLLDPMVSLDQLAPEDLILAREIVVEMEGLPLALEQAGAYIEATQCGLSDYLHLFRTAQYRLLDEHEPSSDHPLSVSRTFALAFERVEQRNLLAAELLTTCAFLAPEALPETFFLEGASSLDPMFEALATDPLAFSEAIKVLLSYSLIQRHTTTHTVIVHRLVQAVLKGRLSEAAQHIWTRRVIEVMGQLFPSSDEMQADYWPICDQLITHAQVCLILGDQWNTDATLRIPLMSHVATYLFKRAQYTEAESLFECAVQMGEQVLGSEHPLLAEALHGLANLFLEHSKYNDAEPLLKRVLRIREQALGEQHPLIGTSLESLGRLYNQQGKYEWAEPLFQRALCIHEQALGSEHPQVAYPLNNLGLLYWKQGKYEQAESCYQRALCIREQALGSEHTQVAYPLNNLGLLYWEQGKYEQAESCYQRALHIHEQVFGSEHPRVAYPLYNLGGLYCQQGKYEQAESFYQRALHIWKQAFGPEALDVAYPLNGLGDLYFQQGKYEQAKSCYQRALRIWKQALGSEHTQVAYPLNGLGDLYCQQGKYEQAESCYQRALRIHEQIFGSEHPEVAYPLNGLGELYYQQGKYEQAESCYQRVLCIREQALGPEHPQVAYPLNGLANLYREQGKYEQAKLLYLRALTLHQQHLDPLHPDIAETLHHFAHLHQAQQKTTEALSLYQQALVIREQALGPDHPKTRKTRTDYAQLLEEVKKE